MNSTHLPQKPEILPPLKPNKTEGAAKRPKFAHPDPETDRISKQHHAEQVKRDKEYKAKAKKEEDRRLTKAYERIAKERNLTPKQIEIVGRMVTAEWCDRHEIYPAAMAFLFKYYGSDLLRVRFMEPPEGQFEIVRRYSQPNYSPPEAYYCPLWETLPLSLGKKSWKETCEDANQSLVITEGEFKAVAACRIGIACVALGGTSSYSSKARGWTWLPTLDRVKWKGRIVYIANDSDAASNMQVRIAETKLALRLIARGAIVHIVRIPPDGDKKVGLDDYIIKLEKQRKNVREAVQKLLQDTPEWNKDLPLHELNAEFVHCEKPGCIVRLNKPLMDTVGCQPFVTELCADRHHLASTGKDKEKMVSTPRAWMQWKPHNRVYAMTFKPGQPLFIEEQGDRLLNRWRGWPCDPVKGDVKPYLELRDRLFGNAKCQLLDGGRVIGEMQCRHWFDQWAAYRVQHPGVRPLQAVVLHGKQGTGKSMLGRMIGLVHGQHFKEVDQRDLDSQFTGHMECRTFILGDEVITKDNKRSLPELLKNYITRTTVAINKKYIEAYDMPNEVQWLLTSNHDNAMHIEDEDRRYSVFHVKSPPLEKEFRERIGRWMEDPQSPAALLHYLMYEVDCSGFDSYREAPMTEAKEAMQAASRTSLANWVLQLKGDLDSVEQHPAFLVSHATRLHRIPDRATASELLYRFQGDGTYWSAEAMGKELAKAGFKQVVAKVGGSTQRLWLLRPESPK
jgi:hypothetical protein